MLKDLSEAKNALESLIYAAQSRVREDYFINVTTEEQRSELLELSETYDDWLYTDEADEANITTIKEKYNSMMDIIEPAEKRYTEWLQRPAMLKSAYEYVNKYTESIENATAEKPWLDADGDAEVMTMEQNKMLGWLDE
jgi:hypoxia up-regulated 1